MCESDLGGVISYSDETGSVGVEGYIDKVHLRFVRLCPSPW